jgi:hypothetical protein
MNQIPARLVPKSRGIQKCRQLISYGPGHSDLNWNRYGPLSGSGYVEYYFYDSISFDCYGALRYWQ